MMKKFTNIILFILIFVNNLFATDKPQAGIFIENHDGLIVHGHPKPGITEQIYLFGHTWNYLDFNNDEINDFLYSGTMRPTDIKMEGKNVSGVCGLNQKCKGEMPGPTLYLGQKDGSYINNSQLIIDKRETPGQMLPSQQLIADFNNDGILDFYLADTGMGEVAVTGGFRDSYFLSQQDGTWIESS